MAVHKTGGLAIFATLTLAACSGGGSPISSGAPSATAPPVVTRSYSFPVGDASASAGGTAWDITGVTTTLSGQFGDAGGDSYDTLRVDVTFVQGVSASLPIPGAALNSGNELGIRIGLDTDANPSTGEYSDCSNSGTLSPFEYSTDQGDAPSRLTDGNYAILKNGSPISIGGNNSPAEAMVNISGNTLSETFFLTAIGVGAGKIAPKIGILVSAFNGADYASTDCVPKAPTSEVFTV